MAGCLMTFLAVPRRGADWLARFSDTVAFGPPLQAVVSLFRGGGIFFFLELELQISNPRSLKKPVQFPRYAEIRQNNARKNCGKDLNSTLWFAPFYCRSVRDCLLYTSDAADD